MDAGEFEILQALVVPLHVHQVAAQCGLDEIAAAKAFYQSKTYEALEEEETKVWHFNPLTICDMFIGEQKTGEVNFPD